jgi:hypothetical protein
MIGTRPRPAGGAAQLAVAPMRASLRSEERSTPAPTRLDAIITTAIITDALRRALHRALRRARRDDPTVAGAPTNLNARRQCPARRAGRLISLFSDAQKGEGR